MTPTCCRCDVLKVKTNAAAFSSQLKAAFAGIEADLDSVCRVRAEGVFTDIVENTPQWTGNLAGNWRLGVGVPDTSFTVRTETPFSDTFRELQRGADPAVGEALSLGREAISKITYKVPVFITNQSPIAQAVEDESIYIRPVNLVDGRVAMVAVTAMKWEGKLS